MWRVIFFFLGGEGLGGGAKRGMVPYTPKGPIEKQKEVKNYLILFLGANMFFLLFSKYFFIQIKNQ
jgi:hypothetical protein